MGLDIRRPIGYLFVALGLLIAGYGLVSDKAIYQRSLGYNVNLGWGICLLIFGLVCLALAWRGAKAGTVPQSAHDARDSIPPRGPGH
jgi:hypothetical protein